MRGRSLSARVSLPRSVMPLEHEPARGASNAATAGRHVAGSLPAGQPAPPQPAASTPQARIAHHCFSDEAHDTVVHFQVLATALLSWPCAAHVNAAAAVVTLCSAANVMVGHVIYMPSVITAALPGQPQCMPACLPGCRLVPTTQVSRGATHF